MKNRIYIIFILIILQLNIIAVPCKTYASSDIVSIQSLINSTEPRSDKIGWQYQTVNGVIYRRLYNFTTGKPLSGWEVAP